MNQTTPHQASDKEPGGADARARSANAGKAMKEVIKTARKLGGGAAGLLRKLKKDRSPEAMIETLDSHMAGNQARREQVSGRVERLYKEITAKKAEYEKAPKARQRVLNAELRSLLTGYKSAERELNVLLENERNLSLLKGRLNELVAYGMSGVSETALDDVTDDIEEAVAEAESVAGASRDLERAGKRRERESDTEDLWDELADFDEQETPVSPADEPKTGETEQPPPAPKTGDKRESERE